MSFQIEPICAIATAAGQATLPIYHSDFAVKTKADKTPVTQADLTAHNIIKQQFADLTPDIAQLSEEAADISFAQRSQWSRYWLIDPLDGTKEFINKNGQFTVNIALIENQRPVLGVVYAPTTDTLWFGSTTYGAFKKVGEQPAIKITTRPAADKVRVLVSRSHRSASIDNLLERLANYEPVAMGSSLKFCAIAEGAADFYPRLGPTSEWDTAAAQAVLEAAGGRVTLLDGQPLRYNTKDSLLNPHFLAYGDTQTNWQQYID